MNQEQMSAAPFHGLGVLEELGVEGAFGFAFVAPTSRYTQDPKYDLDMASYSPVKSYADEHGTTYADLPRVPRESFHTAADWCAK